MLCLAHYLFVIMTGAINCVERCVAKDDLQYVKWDFKPYQLSTGNHL